MSLEKSVVARYKKFGENFEILVDSKGAEEFKEGNSSDDVLRLIDQARERVLSHCGITLELEVQLL